MTQAKGLQQIEDRFRDTFVAELPERLAQVEGLLLDWEAGRRTPDTAFHDTYRLIHSLKGACATFGLHAFTAVCHEIEDYLSLCHPPENLPAGFIANTLKLLDLIGRGAAQMQRGEDATPATEAGIDALHKQMFSNNPTALVVTNSRLATQMTVELLREQGFRALTVDDPFAALHRAMSQTTDLVIASAELHLLRGEALFGALRLAASRNSRAWTILLTATPRPVRRHKRSTDPDMIVARDIDFVTNLRAALQTVLTGPRPEEEPR